ncbi:MAG: hypothetical protein E6J90_41065 [Deltaproteobacteria bacterium]|nr:MAG: hypothetical protein E6J90_41065 [Deltaproteobacteria bacterium]
MPNILFIPDGFTAAHAQEGEFRKIVLKTVKFLRKDQRTSPWDLLKHSINFWMVWIESQEPGCTVLGEIVPVTSGGTLQGEPMPERKAPSAPGASPPPWTLEEMLNEVGLPIPADALVSLQPAAIAVQMLAKINDWTTLYGAKVTGRISLTNYTAWSLRADRRLLDERNTGLGIAVGGRPNAENPIRSAMSLMSGLRTSRAQLDDMLSALTDGKGNTIGATWVTGKDRSRVFALLGGTRGAGAESETLIASTVVSKLDPVKGTGLVDFDHVLLGPGVNGGRSMAVIPHPLPKTLSFGAVFTVAHETAHSQHLGDEYGATGRIASTTAVDDLNLQDELSAMAPTPFGGPAITLNGTRLKWLWPRIEKAGALAATPVANTSGGFDLSLRSGHAAVFNPGDEIQVRERPLTPGPRTSDVLVVQTVTKSKLVATPKAAPVTTSPVTFGKGSVVYKPKVRAGAPLMLVADLIRDWITFTGMPLNASGTSWTCGAGGRSVGVQPANNLPTTGLRTHHPKYTAWIVGLYEGGKDFQCGIYHPTGACMMRINVPYQQRPLPSVASWAYRFCPVCRYVLVDALDPSKHGANDAWFDTRYPV